MVDGIHLRRYPEGRGTGCDLLMIRQFKLSRRQWLIVLHDLLATAAAVVVTLVIRFEDEQLNERISWFWSWLPLFVVYAGLVYMAARLHEAKWRFTSLSELTIIARVSLILAVSMLALDYLLLSPAFYGTFYFGKITVALYWLMQMAFLAGPRIVYRYFRYTRIQKEIRGAGSASTLILGRAADAEVPLRGIESGAIRKIQPIGILSPARSDFGATIRGVPVLGGFDDLERVIAILRDRGTEVARLVLTASALEQGNSPESILMKARRLGIAVSRLPSLEEGAALQLAPVAVEDLLLRGTVKIDYARLENLAKGKSIVVTGGGGSIGSEICDRVLAFGAARLLIVENSEPALYAVLQSLAAKGYGAKIEHRLADVRDRARIFGIFSSFKPDIVFHAAALKHVPMLEQDWDEGVKTNIFGSVNVADAAVEAGVSAMVMISTDKAIEPVSVLGATKRFAEMYCQALDADIVSHRAASRAGTRLISVRFGNVLASNGSVVPKFKAQIEAGGPLTVTHPDMVRYFMTIREACDLVLCAASHALGGERQGVSVYVLNMGQPVRITELAERMIRLSGLEPGRDIEIQYMGVRPGERLHEILFAREETSVEVGIEGIVASKPSHPGLADIKGKLETLERCLAHNERVSVDRVLREVVPDFGGAPR